MWFPLPLSSVSGFDMLLRGLSLEPIGVGLRLRSFVVSLTLRDRD